MIRVCITGHNRSGTTLMARMLQACGLDLGPPEVLDPTVWEHKKLRGICEQVLTKIHGQIPNKKHREQMEWELWPQFKEAVDAVFEEHPPSKCWGWKDPQAGLLVDFWRRYFAEKGEPLKWVVMLRNPIECAQSLVATGHPHGPEKYHLNWGLYYHKLLSELPDARVILVDYDALLGRFVPAELRQVLDFCAIQNDGTGVAEALKIPDPSKRHYEWDGAQEDSRLGVFEQCMTS